MLPYDMKTLGDRLNELAEVFDKKPVGEKGLTVWFGVLREFPTEKVCSILISWPKSHTKFPSPAEVWKAVNEIGINDREKKAEQENGEEFFQRGSPQAKRFIAEIRQILKKPRLTPTQHFERNLIRFPAGHIGHDWAKDVLKKRGIVCEREPGDDDELAA